MDIVKSKKFQAAVVGMIGSILVIYVPALRDVPLEAVLGPIVAYIIGQGLADFGKERAKVEQEVDTMRD